MIVKEERLSVISGETRLSQSGGNMMLSYPSSESWPDIVK